MSLAAENIHQETVAATKVHKPLLPASPSAAGPEAREVGGDADILVDALLRVAGLSPGGDQAGGVLGLESGVLAAVHLKVNQLKTTLQRSRSNHSVNYFLIRPENAVGRTKNVLEI